MFLEEDPNSKKKNNKPINENKFVNKPINENKFVNKPVSKNSFSNNTVNNYSKNYFNNNQIYKNRRIAFVVIFIYIMFYVFNFITGFVTEENKYSHESYTSATLDMLFKGEFKEYIIITDSTYSEANQLYKDSLLYDVYDMEDYYDVEIKDGIKNIFSSYQKTIYKMLEYEVYELESNKKSAVVEIKYYPIKYKTEYAKKLDDVYEDLEKDYENLEKVDALNNYVRNYGTQLLNTSYYETSSEPKYLKVDITLINDVWTIDYDKLYELYNLMYIE